MADFWDEQGYDDEGHWRESDTSVNKDFVLDDPGNYYIYLNLVSQNVRSVNAINVNVEQGVKGFVGFLLAAILFGILAAVMFSRSRSYNELPFPYYES
jgi:hypothetical protein